MVKKLKIQKKIIKKAVLLSFLIVNLVYFLLVLSYQLFNLDKFGIKKIENVVSILLVVYGDFTKPLITFTVVALCTIVPTYYL